MAEEDNLAFEEEEEEGKKDDEKGGLSENLTKILTYTGIVLGVVFISVLAAISVNIIKGTAGQVVDTTSVRSAKGKPKDVYPIPEFKLALDKKGDESMATIVQVKLAIAYEAENQATLTEIIKRKEQIRDKVQYVIARKSFDEISRAQSRDESLKQDLLYELRKIVKGEILDIYFDTFVISRVPG